MPFVLDWSREAANLLANLETKTAKQIVKKLEVAKENPYRFLQKLKGRAEFKLRVGDYRLIITLLPEKKLLFVKTLGHRKNIYSD